MTSKQVQILLKSLKDVKRLVRATRQRYDEIDEYYDSLKATDYAKRRTLGGVSASVVERTYERVEKIKNDYIKAFELQFEIEDRIEENMQSLNAEEKSLVTERFMLDISMSKLHETRFLTYEALKNKFFKIYEKMAKKG